MQHSLHNLKLDASDLGKPLDEQMRNMLVTNAVRVVDLFRAWDPENAGFISRKNFRSAIARLGSDAPRQVVDKLFDAIDADHNGKLEYNDLNRLLRRGGSMQIDPRLLPGGGGTELFTMNKQAARGLQDQAVDQGVHSRQPASKLKTRTDMRADKAYSILGSLT